jgi:hypothetical protein
MKDFIKRIWWRILGRKYIISMDFANNKMTFVRGYMDKKGVLHIDKIYQD